MNATLEAIQPLTLQTQASFTLIEIPATDVVAGFVSDLPFSTSLDIQSVKINFRNWLSSELENVDKFGNLNEGWDGYSAVPPNDSARKFAKDFLRIVSNAFTAPVRVAPSVVGGVGVTFEEGEKGVYVEIDNDGNAFVMFLKDTSEPVVTSIQTNLHGLRNAAKRIREHLNA